MLKLCVYCQKPFEALRSAKYCSLVCLKTAKKAVNAAYMRRWSEKNPDIKKQRDQTYKQSHRKELAAKQQKYQRKHYADIKEQKRLWKRSEYHKKRGMLIKRAATYRENNRELLNEKASKYAKEHPEVARSAAKRRRAQLNGSIKNDISITQWEEIKIAFDNCCAYCDTNTAKLTIDHITPLTKGGQHTLWNIVQACKSCNSKKSRNGVLKPVQPLLITVASPRRPTLR
mgnify:FL=1